MLEPQRCPAQPGVGGLGTGACGQPITAVHNITELSNYGLFLSCSIHVKQGCKMFLQQAVQGINTTILNLTLGCENVGFLMHICGEAVILK